MSRAQWWEKTWDFIGSQVYTTTPGDNADFLITDTSSAGTPTYVQSSGGTGIGELKVDMDAQSEVQNVCVSQHDILEYPVSKIRELEFTLKMNQASVGGNTTFAFGLASARNDALASIANRLLGRILGSGSGTELLFDATDGTNSQLSQDSGLALINAYRRVLFKFEAGISDIRIFVDQIQVCTGVKFSLAAMTTNFQIFAQIQKTTGAAADGFTLDRIHIEGVR